MMISYKHRPDAEKAITFRTNRIAAERRLEQLVKEIPAESGAMKFRKEAEAESIRKCLAKYKS